LLLALIAGMLPLASGSSIAQEAGPPATYLPPTKLWLSVEYSPHLATATDWKWLREQCQGGKIVNTLKPVAGKIGGIVLPIFDDGRCFYSTALEPFQDQNPDAVSDEAMVRELLKAAGEAQIPVYFAVNMLTWDKVGNSLGTSPGVFQKHPEWREVNRSGDNAAQPEGQLASPWHPEVKATLEALLKEIAQKFPEASGLMVDCRLAFNDTLGFSKAARTASMAATQLDPASLDLAAKDDPLNVERIQAWKQWRRDTLAELLKSALTQYQSIQSQDTIILCGEADSYAARSYDYSITKMQDWRHWVSLGLAHTVMLDGFWRKNHRHHGLVNEFERETQNPDSLMVKGAGRPVTLIPASTGSRLMPDGDFRSDWQNLKAATSGLDNYMVALWKDQDLQDALKVLEQE
jgi:hypothetical protein